MNRLARPFAGLALILAMPALAGDARVRVDDVGSKPLKEEIRETFELGSKGRIEIESIGGSVRVEATGGSKVEMAYERSGASQQDLECEKLRHELRDGELKIWVETKRNRACQVVRIRDNLALRVPRDASISMESIGDSVHVTGVEGMVELDSIGDTAILNGVTNVDANSIGDTLKLDVTRVGDRGIRINSVGDDVELKLPGKIDAELEIDSVGDEITVAGHEYNRHDGDRDGFERTLGKGGPRIEINSVGDSVTVKGLKL